MLISPLIWVASSLERGVSYVQLRGWASAPKVVGDSTRVISRSNETGVCVERERASCRVRALDVGVEAGVAVVVFVAVLAGTKLRVLEVVGLEVR